MPLRAIPTIALIFSSGLALLDQRYVCTVQTTQDKVAVDQGYLMSIVVTFLTVVLLTTLLRCEELTI